MIRLVLVALASVAVAGCGVDTAGEVPSPGPGVPVPVHSGPSVPFEGGTYVGACGKSAGVVTVTNTGNVGERVVVRITWLGHPPVVEERKVMLPFGGKMQVRFQLHASASVRKLLQGGCEYSAVATGVFGKVRKLRLTSTGRWQGRAEAGDGPALALRAVAAGIGAHGGILPNERCGGMSRTGRLPRPAGECATMGAASSEEPDMTKFMLLQNYGPTAACDAPMTEWAPADIKAHIDFQLALNAELAGNGELVDAQGLAGGCARSCTCCT
jgi:hypothetical protein